MQRSWGAWEANFSSENAILRYVKENKKHKVPIEMNKWKGVAIGMNPTRMNDEPEVPYRVGLFILPDQYSLRGLAF